jgi:poly(A) polymerase
MKETAISIVKRLRDAGHTAYFNGGCVRDMVRGVEPEDIDIATSATHCAASLSGTVDRAV